MGHWVTLSILLSLINGVDAMLVHTNFYKLKMLTSNFFFDAPKFIYRNDYDILYSAVLDYYEEDIREEAFSKFDRSIDLGTNLGKWHGRSMCAGDVIEFVYQDNSKITEFCLAAGWKRMEWFERIV